MMLKKFLAGAALCTAVCHPAALAQSNYASLTVFGDSLSANAAIAQVSPLLVLGPPYYMGRFSNGPVYAEYLPSLLGIKGSFTDLAVGGAYSATLNETLGSVAVTGTNLNPVLNLLTGPNPFIAGTYNTSVQGQIQRYLASTGGSASSNGLYVVYGGANDYLTMAATIAAQPSLTTAQITGIVGQQVMTTVGNLTADVTLLAEAGAKAFVVPVLPNLGATPSLNGTAASASLGNLTSFSHNSALASAMGQLGQSLGVKIFLVDTASLFNDIIANPAKYGVSNVTQACVGATTLCSAPSSYLFWDSVHPTAGIHQIFADAVAATVDAPLVIGAQGKMADVAVQTIFDALSSRVEALQQGANGLTINGPGGAFGHVDSANPVSVYVTGTYGQGLRHDQTDETGFAYSNGTVLFGADYRADAGLAFGAQFGFGSTGASLKDGMGNDDLRTYSVALYGATYGEHFYASLAGIFAYQQWDKLDRNSFVVGQVAAATSAGGVTGAKLEGGYLMQVGGFSVGPRADLRLSRISIDAYVEQGAVAVNEAVQNQSFSTLVSEIGGQIATRVDAAGMTLRPSLAIDWDHQYSPHQRQLFSQLASLPEASIETTLPLSAEDWARVSVGLNLQASQSLVVVANIDATIGRSDGQDYSGMVKVLYQF